MQYNKFAFEEAVRAGEDGEAYDGLHKDVWSSVAAAGGTSASFEISVGVHQGSVLSPLLFNLMKDEAAKYCRREVLRDMLYADDLVLTVELKAEVREHFNRWKSAIVNTGVKVNLGKRSF